MKIVHRSLPFLLLLALVGAGSTHQPQHEAQPSDFSTLELNFQPRGFMGGVITQTPSSGEFLAIIELSPAKNPDLANMCKVLRSGHPVALRIPAHPNDPPVLITDVTSMGEVLIRCKSMAEAQHVIERLHEKPPQ